MTGDPHNRFKLPGSSLDEVFKALQGYASFGKAGSLGDISRNTGLHETVISRNVGFLLSLDLLEGGRNKVVTAQGSKLGLALMHNMPEEVERILSDIVSDSEFLKNVLAAVRIRKGMDESSLRSHIAYSAGLSKTGATATGSGAVIELLKRSGHLKPEDGKLIVGAPTTSSIDETSPLAVGSSSVGSAAVKSLPSITFPVSSAPPFSISIEINVTCGPDDIDGLGAKLRKLIDEFSDRTPVDSDEA